MFQASLNEQNIMAVVTCFNPHNNKTKNYLLFSDPQSLTRWQLNITDRNPISALAVAGLFSRERTQ